MKNKGALWITTTAIFVALLIGAQVATRPFGQFVTGSLVNLILIVAVMTSGLASGIVVAILSQIFAQLFGIGPPFPLIMPFIIAGNATLVLIWHVMGKIKTANKHVMRIAATILAAVGKFIVLYFGVVHVVVPFLIDAPPQVAERISYMFSYPQLITALIGGVIALAVLPVLEKFKAAKRD